MSLRHAKAVNDTDCPPPFSALSINHTVNNTTLRNDHILSARDMGASSTSEHAYFRTRMQGISTIHPELLSKPSGDFNHSSRATIKAISSQHVGFFFFFFFFSFALRATEGLVNTSTAVGRCSHTEQHMGASRRAQVGEGWEERRREGFLFQRVSFPQVLPFWSGGGRQMTQFLLVSLWH